MGNLREYSEEFKFKFDKFLIGCDSLEEMGLWDVETYGQMEGYYTNDFVSVIIKLIAADGVFSEKEILYMNDIFGFEYTKKELLSVYRECQEGIEYIFDEGVENGLSLLRTINPKMASAYVDLLILICDIVIESDGEINKAEVEIAERLKAEL